MVQHIIISWQGRILDSHAIWSQCIAEMRWACDIKFVSEDKVMWQLQDQFYNGGRNKNIKSAQLFRIFHCTPILLIICLEVTIQVHIYIAWERRRTPFNLILKWHTYCHSDIGMICHLWQGDNYVTCHNNCFTCDLS